MPDKQNDSKFMSMLERRGIVRKAAADDESQRKSPDARDFGSESDLRAMLGAREESDGAATPAARQPIPGFSNPIIPGEKRQNPESTGAGAVSSRVVDISKPILSSEPQPFEAFTDDAEQSSSADSDSASQSSYTAGIAAFADSFPNVDTFTSADAQKESPAATSQQQADSPDSYDYTDSPGAEAENKPAAEHTDEYIEIDDLYRVLSINSKKTETIYLIEDYLKTLPDSLPDESRRDIVIKIVTASGFDYDLLMGDGVLRVKMLKDYAEKFARRTDGFVAERYTELNELEQQMQRIREQIDDRRELHKRQFFAIETEAQRLKEILTFISG